MTAPEAGSLYPALRYPAQVLVEHCRQVVASTNVLWLPHFGFLATPVSRDWIVREPALQAVE
jgi:hypothetical protein